MTRENKEHPAGDTGTQTTEMPGVVGQTKYVGPEDQYRTETADAEAEQPDQDTAEQNADDASDESDNNQDDADESDTKKAAKKTAAKKLK